MFQPMNPLACTVQPHPRGGYTPTLHVFGAAVPAPADLAVTLPSVHEAIRYAMRQYGVSNVQVSETPVTPPAFVAAPTKVPDALVA